MKRRIGSVDYGKVRLGTALSDPLQIVVSPFKVLPHLKDLESTADALVHLFAPYFPLEAFLIGLPLLLNGKEGEMALKVRQWASLLQNKISFPIILWDERLSSQQAERELQEVGLNRKKRSSLIDCRSAALLLQHYLDSKKMAPSFSL
jgi:putative holliday junction resolvase